MDERAYPGRGSLAQEPIRTSSLREDVLRLSLQAHPRLQGSQSTGHLLPPSHPMGKSPKSLLAQGQRQPMEHAASCLSLLDEPFSLISVVCPDSRRPCCLAWFLSCLFHLSLAGYHYLHRSAQRHHALKGANTESPHSSPSSLRQGQITNVQDSFCEDSTPGRSSGTDSACEWDGKDPLQVTSLSQPPPSSQFQLWLQQRRAGSPFLFPGEKKVWKQTEAMAIQCRGCACSCWIVQCEGQWNGM